MLDQVLEECAWVKESKYQSPLIVNELISIMAHKVLRSLLVMLPQCWFSLLADETRDISNREQLVLCIRWVSESYEINEDFVALVQLENNTAATIYEAIKDALLRLGMQQVAHKVKSIKEGLNFAMDLIQLIKLSPKREVILENVQKKQESKSGSRVKSLCPTRWTARTGAMQTIINNYTALRETMEISSHGTDDCSRRTNGMLSLMDKFSTYFGLELSVFIFNLTEQLSVTLQADKTNVDDCFMAVDLCIRSLERNRTDLKFKSFYYSVVLKASQVLCDPPVLPRQRQIPGDWMVECHSIL